MASKQVVCSGIYLGRRYSAWVNLWPPPMRKL
jgi:hypothetical protein